MTPSASRRSSRRLTAGALSATRAPMSWKERRAFSRRSATIRRSMSSMNRYSTARTQRIGIENGHSQRNHCASPNPERTRRRSMAQQTAPAPAAGPAAEHDFMPLNGVDHVEIYVGNAIQAAYYYVHAFGFREVAYAGLETGQRDRAPHVLEQGRIRLVLTGALHSDSPIAAHQRTHGDGVKVIALSVPDVDRAYREATTRGATGVAGPQELSDEHGTVRLATIETYGETLHTFVDRSSYTGPFLPGYGAVDKGADTGMLLGIDHIVGNVELGHMDEWVKYYEDVFGMREMLHFSDDDISTEYSALMSKVVTNGNGRVKFPLNEPAEGKRKSQIDEYLEYYGGAGAQHIAVATRDI